MSIPFVFSTLLNMLNALSAGNSCFWQYSNEKMSHVLVFAKIGMIKDKSYPHAEHEISQNKDNFAF